MIKRKLVTCVVAIAGMCVILTGCSNNKDKATPDTAVTATPVPTNTPTPEPTATPSPSPTPTPEDEWVYQIVQNGYYNAAAQWDENEALVAYPEAVEGEYIYYNDCDEYYNNFISNTNVFNDAKFTLDDEERHSGDNSVKVTGRETGTKGFSGFALRFTEANAIPYSNYNNTKCTLGFWVYYQDDFNNSIPDELTFCVWSNLDSSLDPVASNATDEPGEEATDEEEALYKILKAENDYAAEQGFSKITTVTVPIETWTYVEVPFTISFSEENTEYEPMLAIATLGESNSDNVTYYNPFYIDDITVTYESTK